MDATEAAKRVIEKFGTNDVFLIAEKSNVKIIYEKWHPVSIGEFDKISKTIRVNLRALDSEEFSEKNIIAHELGHFFAAEFRLNRENEEVFAVEFANELTG